MGSAAGRRKCCKSFYDRGYEHGYDNPEDVCDDYRAGTVSKSFTGLYRKGFAVGQSDKIHGEDKRPFPYDNYCCDRDQRRYVLDFMKEGYTLAYAPDARFPDRPFALTSPDGCSVLRRSCRDLDSGPQDYSPHRLQIVRALAEERSADVKSAIVKARKEGRI